MSYCDNCIHQLVCRFTKDIQKRESAPVEYLSGYTDGPTIRYAVDCPYKMASTLNKSYFEQGSGIIYTGLPET